MIATQEQSDALITYIGCLIDRQPNKKIFITEDELREWVLEIHDLNRVDLHINLVNGGVELTLEPQPNMTQTEDGVFIR